MNRASKSKCGLTGITLRKGAVHKWILSHPARAEITQRCKDMAGKGDNGDRMRKDVDLTRIIADEEAVTSVISTVTSMCNPFMVDIDGTVNQSTGRVAPSNIQSDLQTAETTGQLKYKTFVDERPTLLMKRTSFRPSNK